MVYKGGKLSFAADANVQANFRIADIRMVCADYRSSKGNYADFASVRCVRNALVILNVSGAKGEKQKFAFAAKSSSNLLSADIHLKCYGKTAQMVCLARMGQIECRYILGKGSIRTTVSGTGEL